MSLNHVCRWTEHGWERTTAFKEVLNHPGGTVSAASGLFICELCHQHIIFTNGEKLDRYFKHSSAEQDKDCKERTKYCKSKSYSLQASERDLPLRLEILSLQNFELQVGLPPVPESIPEKHIGHKIIISSTDNVKYEYSFERISEDRITYLSVGNIPCEKYHITIVPDDSGLSSFWPESTGGIFSGGTLFDGITGKKLPYDADVVSSHEIISSRSALFTAEMYA